MTNKKHLFERVHHFIIGFILLLKGADKISHHNLIGATILTFGLIIIGYFIYTSIKKITIGVTPILVHLFEAVALLFTSYIYYQEGKVYLPYVIIAASIALFIISFVSIYKQAKGIKN